MSDDTGTRLIDRLIRNDWSERQDAYQRAKIEHDRGVMPDKEFADYVQDLANGQAAIDTWNRVRPRQ